MFIILGCFENRAPDFQQRSAWKDRSYDDQLVKNAQNNQNCKKILTLFMHSLQTVEIFAQYYITAKQQFYWSTL